MKKIILPIVFLAVAFTSLVSFSALADEKKLYLYTWDTYVAPELFKKFEKETGIKVIVDIYSSNDTLMAKLQSGSPYDIVAPSGNFVPHLIGEKLLQPLPKEVQELKATLAKNVQSPGYDPENTYVLPLFYGTTGLAQNIKLMPEKIESWIQYFNRPANERPMLGALDDLGTAMNLASLSIGKPFCDGSPETLKALEEAFKKQKPSIKAYGSTGYSERLAANEISLHTAWSGDVYRVRQENKDIQYVYPKEGVELWIDNLAIPAEAKNVDSAVKFIQFILRPENSAAYSLSSGQIPTAEGALALLPQELRESPEFNVPAGIPAVTSIACSPEVVNAYSQIWERLMR